MPKPIDILDDNGYFVKVKAPIKVNYDVSYVCNARCRFCYLPWEDLKRMGKLKPPNMARVREIFSKLQEAGVAEVVINGGDLFALKNCLDILKLGYRFGFRMGFSSNGMGITQSRAQELVKYIDSCGVSFHGPNAKIYEYLSGVRGSFRRAITGLKNLNKAGISPSILFNPVPKNYLLLYKTIESLIERHSIVISSLQINRLIPQGRGHKNWEKDVFLPFEEYRKIFPQLAMISKKFGIHIETGDVVPLCHVDKEYRQFIVKCYYGTTMAHVDEDGNLKKCGCTSEIFGNILTTPLTELWAKNRVLRDFRKLKWAPKECKDCFLLDECGAGCPISVPDAKEYCPDLFFSPDKVPSFITRPKINTRYRFMKSSDKYICFPHDMPMVLYSRKRPPLLIDLIEKEVIELCNGKNSIERMFKVVSKKFNLSLKQTKTKVKQCLRELNKYGYLVTYD